ncbi:MAG: DUF2922 domain-containing protein [Tissierellia bacterium]|nr:DUF2922 domain-containing protein [Tissierellia bacterium]
MARKTLKMVFKDDQDNQRTISVTDPKDHYEENEVKNAMDAIIASNALMAKEAVLTGKVKAYLENVEVEPIGIE